LLQVRVRRSRILEQGRSQGSIILTP